MTLNEMNVKAPNDDILKKKGLNWYSAILDLLCSIWILTFWATDTYSILIILKENIFMQILSAEKKIKILNIAFSSTYIYLITQNMPFFFLGVSTIRIISYLFCVSHYNFFCITRYMHHDWNSYSTPASQLPYSIHHMLHIHVYTGTMDCPSMPGPVVFIG